MDILNLHFSNIDLDKPEQSKAIIEHFLLAETDISSQLTAELAELIFRAYGQGYSQGYSEGSDYANGYFDNDSDFEE